MKDKVLVNLSVPEIDEVYDIFIPINIRIGNVIELLNKAVFELSNGVFESKKGRLLYNVENATSYDLNSLVRETNIRSGSKVILM